jgi:SpoU rRNA methylase family enzyme
LTQLPHLLDAVFGGEPRSIDLSSVAAVGTRPKGGAALRGGLPDRLKVSLSDGTEELFVVNRLEAAVARVREAREALPSQT